MTLTDLALVMPAVAPRASTATAKASASFETRLEAPIDRILPLLVWLVALCLFDMTRLTRARRAGTRDDAAEARGSSDGASPSGTARARRSATGRCISAPGPSTPD